MSVCLTVGLFESVEKLHKCGKTAYKTAFLKLPIQWVLGISRTMETPLQRKRELRCLSLPSLLLRCLLLKTSGR